MKSADFLTRMLYKNSY